MNRILVLASVAAGLVLAGCSSCPKGQTACGSTCANLQTDNANCGACGRVCPAGSACAAGACSTTCAAGFSVCAGDGGPSFCADLKADPENCGACGTTCPAGEVCSAGACAESCAAGTTACAGAKGGHFCADLQQDVNNCGTCGKACPAGQVCASSKCVLACAAGTTECQAPAGGAPFCANLSTDSENCGACGAPCPEGQLCVSGACAESCATGFTACGGRLDGGIDAGAPYCANLLADVNNCGGCGAPCPTGQLCVSGACAENCATGFTACGGTLDGGVDAGAPYCANLLADVNNCGGCGAPCPEGQLCNGAGRCATSCLASESLCGGLCTDTLTDRENCGACAGDGGMTCPQGQICNGMGKCTESCAAGYVTCGADSGFPYCSDLDTDSKNCGACGISCDPGATCDGTGHCACAVSGNVDCTAGGTICSDGHCAGGSSCTDTSTDPANCGACGSVCSGGACYGGTACLCPSGKMFCATAGSATAGMCDDLQTDIANCGACGLACRANNGGTTSCTTGKCACADGVTEGSVAGGQACSASCDCVSGLQCSAGVCGGTPEALIFGPSVTNGSSSMEATRLTAEGFTVTVVDATTWGTMTHAQFATYQLLVFGDPTCGGSASILSPAVANESTWAPVVNGNVIVIGTDPDYHNTYGHPSAGAFAGQALAYAGARVGQTGLYLDLSCYYASSGAGSDAPILDGLESGFTIHNGGGNSSHVVASVPQLLGVTDSDLSNWGESIHETFTRWPSDFVVYAIDAAQTGYTAPDGTVGAPYIVGRGGGLSPGAVGLEGPVGSGFLGTEQVLTASVQWNGSGVSGVTVTLKCTSGPCTAGATATATTSAGGLATFSYASSASGTDQWTATAPLRGTAYTSLQAGVSWF